MPRGTRCGGPAATVAATALAAPRSSPTARAAQIEVSDDGEGGWAQVYATTSADGALTSPRHVVHNVLLGQEEVSVGGRATGQERLADAVDASKTGRFVRLTITQLGTRWGASLWEVRVFGMWL